MNSKILAALMSLLSIAGIALASSDNAPSLNDRVREKILDNGLRLVVVERHNAPVFFALTSFRVGSCQERPNHSGLSHFLEHMLFKGTENVGTTDFSAEKPIMDSIEVVATEIRNIQITLAEWRFEQFDAYATLIKTTLPQEVRDRVGSSDAESWRETLNRMPTEIDSLPAEMTTSPWVLADAQHNYWELYRRLLTKRIELIELADRQRKYVIKDETPDGIFSPLGGRVNAFTSYDQTTYMTGLPSNAFELWMHMEADRYLYPVFREFYSEKEVVMEEKRMRGSNPTGVLMETLQTTTFQAHPYGRPIIGWMNDLRLTRRTDMEQHFRDYYAPNNCQITIVGDVDTETVFRLGEKHFGKWKPALVAEEVTTVEPKQNAERRVAVEQKAQPMVMISYHAPVAPHPDSYALQMMNMVLSSGRTSRFYRSIFENQKLTAGAPGGSAPSGRYDDTFTLYAVPKAPHTTDEVELAMYAEIEKLATEPVSQIELERVQNQYKRYQWSQLSSNQSLAFALSGSYVNRGDWRYAMVDYQRLLEVTPDDIQRVAKTYFAKTNRTVATTVPPEQVNGGNQQ